MCLPEMAVLRGVWQGDLERTLGRVLAHPFSMLTKPLSPAVAQHLARVIMAVPAPQRAPQAHLRPCFAADTV